MQVAVSSVDQQRLEVAARDVTLRVDRYAEAGTPSLGFRATELLLGALGSCMVGTALEFARRQGLAVSGITMELEDATMSHPTRVGEITAIMKVAGDVTGKDLERLGRVAARCKVHNTLQAATQPEMTLTTIHSE